MMYTNKKMYNNTKVTPQNANTAVYEFILI